MQLTVLAVPDCPHALVLDERLAAVLDGRPGISVTHEVICHEEDAARQGMGGSPTLLIDGTDPFAGPDQRPSISCRVYRDEHGQRSGSPSAAQLRRAIDRALTAAAKPTDPAWLDSLARTRSGRIAPADGGLRAVHQAVLRSFAETGSAPATTSLQAHAEPFDLAHVLAELADGDFLGIGENGQITTAYPFSAAPTAHRVQIAGKATVFAMCAIDALGISAMTGLPTVIKSTDPSTGEPVTVHVDGASSTWTPATAVVYVGHSASDCGGPSGSVCCSYMNFFASRAAAAAWASSHPQITGGILRQRGALRIGIGIFGRLLS
jgi:Alkylmercury lyase